MIFGYNTDVKVGKSVYHVQTEDRGAKHPMIDSVIYHKGRILDRRRTNYVVGEVSPEEIKEMVTKQHRELVDSIKSGAFVPGAQQSDLTVELLNPDSVAQNGRLLFHLKVPGGSKVEACLEVNGTEAERAEAVANDNGEADLEFPIPEGPMAEVLFRATADGQTQTVKFQVKQQ